MLELQEYFTLFVILCNMLMMYSGVQVQLNLDGTQCRLLCRVKCAPPPFLFSLLVLFTSLLQLSLIHTVATETTHFTDLLTTMYILAVRACHGSVADAPTHTHAPTEPAAQLRSPSEELPPTTRALATHVV